MFAVVLGLAASVAGCELFLRVFLPQPLYGFARGLFVPSERYGYALAPGARGRHSQPDYNYLIEANARGFRGPDPDFSAPRRVLVLGDSFGMAQGVDEGLGLVDVARAALKASDPGVEVFNTALSGYSTVNHEKVTAALAAEYRPALSVLLMHLNDLPYRASLKVWDGYLVIKPPTRKRVLRMWLNHHSHLFYLVKSFHYAFMKKERRFQGASLVPPDADVAAFADKVARMRDTLAAAGGRLAVVNVAMYDDAATREASEAKIAGALKALNVPYTLWESVSPPEARTRFRFRHDQHWNAEGHRFYGGLLAALIREHL